jgi:hypothetical protein
MYADGQLYRRVNAICIVGIAIDRTGPEVSQLITVGIV